jgi:REP element-mobilizing transposase RayT
MPRKMRVEYPGAMYHVMSRGDQRDDIFLDDVDRHEFIKTLAEACQKTDWWVHAFCLMKNHYHIVIETPNGNLVAGMQERGQPIAWSAFHPKNENAMG